MDPAAMIRLADRLDATDPDAAAELRALAGAGSSDVIATKTPTPPAEQAAADVAVIEAQTEQAVAVIEAQAAADVAVIEAQAAADAEPVLPTGDDPIAVLLDPDPEPEPSHWYFRQWGSRPGRQG